ncbi:MAG: cellulase family glycosylhydrolase [Methylococcales bacterium]|nr:cellulase family glycosylhydrolase [Methylococcales bacterium]
MNEIMSKLATAIAKFFPYVIRSIYSIFPMTPCQTLFVRGRFLYDTGRKQIILRGVNLPLLDDWNFPGSDKLTEVEQTGANAVRIEWYKDYGSQDRPVYTVTDLDNFLTKCKTNRMIPILGLWDLTCQNDPDLLNMQLISWWTTDPVLSVLKKHQQYLVINLANELGAYRWADDQVTALTAFKNAHKSAITNIRNAGLDMPMMIDAPDCGTSNHAFTSIGQELIDHDPKHNLLLSVHAYWADYDGTAEIQNAVNANLPIVFGEIANKQASEGDECYFDLDGTNQRHSPPTGFTYQSLLLTLKTNDIGWFAWSWGPDGCASRQMSGNGNFNNLTTYGQDIVNNAAYGLKNTAIRSSMFP